MGQIQNSPICVGYHPPHDDDKQSDGSVLESIQVFKGVVQSQESNRFSSKDSHLIIENLQENTHVFSIFDSFDPDQLGTNLSLLGVESLRSYLDSNKYKLPLLKNEIEVQNLLSDAVIAVEKDLCNIMEEKKTPGTSCMIALLRGNKVHLANLGTSRAVLCRSTPVHTQAIHLSRDNKLNQTDESRRIVNLGGRFSEPESDLSNREKRIWLDENGPTITATRALVSSSYKRIGVISSPEIEHFDLVCMDKFIVIASDGLWTVFESDEVLHFIENFKDKTKVVDSLLTEAKLRWISNFKVCPEDITVVVVYLNFLNNDKHKKAGGGYIEMRRNF